MIIFEIKDIRIEDLYDFLERFETALLGAISGNVLPESDFDLKNPLLEGAKPPNAADTKGCSFILATASGTDRKSSKEKRSITRNDIP